MGNGFVEAMRGWRQAALGQLVQLLPQRQGDSVVLEGFPVLPEGSRDSRRSRLMRGGGDPQLPAPNLQESCQGMPCTSRGETSHRLGPHGGQLELAAQLADAVLHHAGVHHAHTPAVARLTVSRRS